MAVTRAQRRARAKHAARDAAAVEPGAGETNVPPAPEPEPAPADDRRAGEESSSPAPEPEPAPAAEAPRPPTAERLAEPAAGKRTRPAGVPAPRAVVVIFPARRWCCPDCLTGVAAPRGRRHDGRCQPCSVEVARRPDRRPRRQPLQREVCQ